MTEIKVTADVIAGTKVVVFVKPYGTFVVRLPGGEEIGSGDTMVAAMEKARGTLTRRKVSVEVPLLSHNFKPGVATGLHAGTGKVLVKIEGQRAEQMASYAPVAFEPDMPIEEQGRLRDLQDTIARAQAEERKILTKYTFRVDSRVKAAIAAAVSEAKS